MVDRVIVKNLPMKITELEVYEHFSNAGLITDINLKYKNNGIFRGFAFIGFQCEEMSRKALDLHNTYLKQNKISVEICYDLDHKSKSQKFEDRIKNTHQQTQQYKEVFQKKDEVTREKLKELMENPHFIEYLNLNQKGTSDLVNSLKQKYSQPKLEEQNLDEDSKEQNNFQDKLANQEISDLEYLQSLVKSSDGKKPKNTISLKTNVTKGKKWKELFNIIIRTKEKLTSKEKKGRTFTKKGIKDFLRPLKYQSLRIPRNVSFVAYIGFKTQKDMNEALVKDKSFLDGVRVRVHKSEKRNESGQILSDQTYSGTVAEEKVLQMAEPVAESGKLFVRNLWYSVTEEEVREIFEKIGPLADVTLPLSKLSRKPKGFAHVSFVLPEHAVKAMTNLNGTSFKGRILHIVPSLHSEEVSEEKSFKKKKKDEKSSSAMNWHNWNTLFLGSGAVIDLMTQNFATSKQQLFENEGNQSVAVNLALGETQIVDETKRFLEDAGVSLEAFTHPGVQRSSSVILAKNLPAKTSAQELSVLFGRHGELGRLLLPPSGVTAIIEFLDPGEAKHAFRDLAYSRFKYLPLYLEWAPILVFKSAVIQKSKSEVLSKEENSTQNNGELRGETIKENSSRTVHEINPEPNTTLYIKNLNSQTEEEAIKEHFSQVGEVGSVLISRHRGLSKHRGLPQGYGFVQFVKSADANKALKQLQNSRLDGQDLILKYSEKKLISVVKSTRKLHNPGEAVTPKLLIKNIPFQATVKEVRQLFQTFGELKSIRLPNKVGSCEHRGFGFIEFITLEEAKKAFDSIGTSTHLYGRRLVLEWAKEEESVEELRRKTAERFIGSGPPNKKQRVEISANENLNNLK